MEAKKRIPEVGEFVISERGTLVAGEPHPMAHDAYGFIFSLGIPYLFQQLGGIVFVRD